MELREIIEAGIRAKGSVNELADYLGLARQHVSNAKAHQRGLPNDACMKLAKLLDVPLETVIGASELATERKEEKRAFWLTFVTNATNLTQLVKFVLMLAIVTNFVTPSPSEAAPARDLSVQKTLYYVKSQNIFHALRFFCVRSSNLLQINLKPSRVTQKCPLDVAKSVPQNSPFDLKHTPCPHKFCLNRNALPQTSIVNLDVVVYGAWG